MAKEVIKPALEKYLKQKGWKWENVDGENISIKTCPFCGKSKGKFHIHKQTTQWRCWGGCPKTGNLYSLKKELGDLSTPIKGVISASDAAGGSAQKNYKTVPMEHVLRWHDALINSPEKLELVMGWRGFSLEAIEHFKLGIRRNPQWGDMWWLSIPHINDGVCHNAKFRTLPADGVDKDFRRIGGYASVLYNADCLVEYEELVLAEAETDTIAIWDSGIKNIVGLTCGADTFLPEWYDQLVDKDKITIALDPDGPGQKGARAIALRLGFDKCWNVLFPDGLDANSLLLEKGSDAIPLALSKLKQFDVAGVLTLDQILVEAAQSNETQEDGLLTPWGNVNRLMPSGVTGGDQIILSATPKTGKTTFAVAWAVALAKMAIPSLIYCLEMKTRRLADKIVAALRNKPVHELTPLDYQVARYELRQIPLYFIDPRVRDEKGSISTEFCLGKIKEVTRRYGIKFVVFDHVHFLCRSLDHITAEVGRTSKDFKLCAEELEVVMCLVAQPRKLPVDRPPTANDLKHSGDLWADADWIMILWRRKLNAADTGEIDDGSEEDTDREAMESKMLVRIDAARFAGGGDAYLHYDGACSTFEPWQHRSEVW